jgi:hypothetical protein
VAHNELALLSSFRPLSFFLITLSRFVSPGTPRLLIYQNFDRSRAYLPFSKNRFLPPFHKLWCTCMPDLLS